MLQPSLRRDHVVPFGNRIRFSDHSSAVLGDGPRGGIDKRCVITMHLERFARPIVIEDADMDAMVAIERAADRAGRTVARALARRLVR